MSGSLLGIGSWFKPDSSSHQEQPTDPLEFICKYLAWKPRDESTNAENDGIWDGRIREGNVGRLDQGLYFS